MKRHAIATAVTLAVIGLITSAILTPVVILLAVGVAWLVVLYLLILLAVDVK